MTGVIVGFVVLGIIALIVILFGTLVFTSALAGGGITARLPNMGNFTKPFLLLLGIGLALYFGPTVFSSLSSKNWMPDISLWLIISLLVTAGLIAVGFLGLYREPEISNAAMWFVRILIAIFTLISISWFLWGSEAVENRYEDIQDWKWENSWFSSNPTPGTTEVTQVVYMGRANGSVYTLSDEYWTMFDWPDNGYCVHVPGNTAGVLDRANDGRDEYSLLSRVAGKKVRVYTLAPGESIGDYTCPKLT